MRQRCGFGCVVCGLPLYEYDHFLQYSAVQEHDPDNIVLLCDQHHREKTSGLLPLAVVEAANADPHNRRAGASQPYELHYSGQSCQAEIGSNVHVWPALADGAFTVPLIVDDTPLVLFRAEDGHMLLTVQLFDASNQLLVQIVDNQLVFSADPWDVEFVGQDVTVRAGPGDIFVRMTFDPPGRVIIDRAHIWRNGIEIDVTPEQVLLVHDRNRFSRNTAVNCVLGVAIGNHPQLGGAISISSSRQPFTPDPAVEVRVMRIMPAGPPAGPP